MEIDEKRWEIKKKKNPDPEEAFQKDLERLQWQKAMLDSTKESPPDVLIPNSVAVFKKVTFARSDDGPHDTNAHPGDQADSDWSLND